MFYALSISICHLVRFNILYRHRHFSHRFINKHFDGNENGAKTRRKRRIPVDSRRFQSLPVDSISFHSNRSQLCLMQLCRNRWRMWHFYWLFCTLPWNQYAGNGTPPHSHPHNHERAVICLKIDDCLKNWNELKPCNAPVLDIVDFSVVDWKATKIV